MDTHASALIIASPSRLRDGLRAMLSAESKFASTFLADCSSAGLQAVANTSPTLVLLDANLPGDDAWRVLDELKKRRPQTRCVVWTHTPAQARRAAAAGADSVLGARFSSSNLSVAIKQAMAESKPHMEWRWPREP